MKLMKLFSLFYFLPFLFLFQCGGESKVSCQTDPECGLGKVCENNKCVAIECADPCAQSTCKAGQVCVSLEDKNVCTAQECSPEKTCTPPKVCDCGICKDKPLVEGEDVVEMDVVSDDKIEKIEKEEISPQKNLTCVSCIENIGICGSNYYCSPLAAGKYCLSKCTNDGDCEPGFICWAVTSEGKQCVAVTYKCVKCVTDGCPEGKICNLSTGQCDQPKPQCDKCTYDYECQKDFYCYRKDTSLDGYCVQSCKNKECPKDFKCTTTDKGVKLCEPMGEGCGACPKEKPFLKDGNCVECLNSTHCPSPKTCNLNTNMCEGQCPQGTYECADKKCHQCCDDTHCKGIGEEKCDPTTYTCKGSPPKCPVKCEPPYPACVEISPGNWQCAQCANNSDCPSGCTCNTQIYTCEGQGGQPCSGPAVKCKSDADCPPNQNFPELACHQEGFCYDKAGGCDGITALCKPGFQCFNLLEIFGGGGIPLPGIPGLGACTCNSGNDCPVEGGTCIPVSFLCLLIPQFCQGGTPPNLCLNVGGILPF